MSSEILLCLVAGATFWSGCAMYRAEVSYYDRNGDGKVDQEKHHYRRIADGDWHLRDDDYDGRYEKKIRLSVGVIESAVDLPVPTEVRIESKP